MSRIKVVSFDLEGTLVTPDFSRYVWHEGIPILYARRYGLPLEEAKAQVKRCYDEVGDACREWYDIKYWFSRFQLGDYASLLAEYCYTVAYYPDVDRVIDLLGKQYCLIICSGSSREFIPYLLGERAHSFSRIFSSISDYGQLKTPDFYRVVCQVMGVLPGEVVHVGDSWRYDYLSPLVAGIKAFYLDRHQPAAHSDCVSSLDEFVRRLDGIQL